MIDSRFRIPRRTLMAGSVATGLVPSPVTTAGGVCTSVAKAER